MVFQNRKEAGERLAEKIKQLGEIMPAVVIALPRGGVPVAYEVSKELQVPLDIIGVRKLGAPHNPEFAVGAIAENDVEILDEDVVQTLGLTEDSLNEVKERELKELRRRVKKYRKERKLENLKGKTTILVDDGVATGQTALAAIRAIKKEGPKKVIFAAPVGAKDSIKHLEKEADQVVCLHTPSSFGAVGAYYKEFGQTTDETVIHLLKKANQL